MCLFCFSFFFFNFFFLFIVKDTYQLQIIPKGQSKCLMITKGCVSAGSVCSAGIGSAQGKTGNVL